jgi:hypothetical protein
MRTIYRVRFVVSEEEMDAETIEQRFQLDRSDLEWAIEEYGVCDVATEGGAQMLVITKKEPEPQADS